MALVKIPEWRSINLMEDDMVEGTCIWDDNKAFYLVERNRITTDYVKRKLKTDVERDFPQLRGYLPGDLVYITLKPGDICEDEYHNRHGVVVYGPDNEGGWQVSAGSGGLRCVEDELTLIRRREDRMPETDSDWQKEEKWLEFHRKNKR